MNTATKITLSRFIITPLFFIVFFVLTSGGEPGWGGLALIWGLFVLSEVSDVLDGFVARRYNQVTDLGKLMDPFADVIFRVTYFVCFAAMKWVPWWAVMIILWREYTIMFIRMLLIKEGTALAASVWGKLKAVGYFFTGLAGMLLLLAQKAYPGLVSTGETVLRILAVVSAFMALMSLISYLILFARRKKN
ncbi:MAG: CDP-diacylglycerol--glycerol-3-phosphate 3-phosphatidyltransferase [Spirochaetales bacterium]|nr:CDP-diacylglycerol--glycerol-3-phosphate 3-phosphatidyltransferase [Spirochaetales bacterium]